MVEYHEVVPVTGPEAFEESGRNARLSQAAMVLTAGAAVGGRAAELEAISDLDMPDDLGRVERRRKMPVEQAAAQLDIDIASHLGQPELRIPASASADITKRLIDKPTAVGAAVLVEANLHSDSRLVRTAAAAAALDTTGPREDVVSQLAEGARSRDPLIRDLGRVGLGRVDPDNEALRYLVGRPAPLSAIDRESHTAVLTHGTFAARARWWRPGGTFYSYLDQLVPPLNMHDPSYQWTGLYSDAARRLAAERMAAWVLDQGLQRPDVFAHSHGGTVASLATRDGLEIDRLVLLSWPVHGEWFPDFSKVGRIIDIRVRWDLVIIADRGGQKYTPPPAYANKVTSHVHGWFDHSDTNDPGYWDRYGLPGVL